MSSQFGPQPAPDDPRIWKGTVKEFFDDAANRIEEIVNTQTRTTCNECEPYDNGARLCPLHGAAEQMRDALEAIATMLDSRTGNSMGDLRASIKTIARAAIKAAGIET